VTKAFLLSSFIIALLAKNLREHFVSHAIFTQIKMLTKSQGNVRGVPAFSTSISYYSFFCEQKNGAPLLCHVVFVLYHAIYFNSRQN
jgi:hypothetical protein